MQKTNVEDEDDYELKRLQELTNLSPEAIEPTKRMRAVLRAVAAAAPDERAGILLKASKLVVPPATEGELNQLLAELSVPGTALSSLQSLTEMTKEAERRAAEIAAQARSAFASRLKELKSEADLTWETIARKSGISRRRLYEIAAGAQPSAETAKILRDYFSRILKRDIQI